MNAELEKGRCLCGKVSYSFNQSDAISAHHCHCKDCQKITGSGKATILLVPSIHLKLKVILNFLPYRVQQDLVFLEVSVKNVAHNWFSFVEENPEIKFIKVGSLDDSSWVTIASNFLEFYCLPLVASR